jgi:tetratricopeptide (TPR) repeat protein
LKTTPGRILHRTAAPRVILTVAVGLLMGAAMGAPPGTTLDIQNPATSAPTETSRYSYVHHVVSTDNAEAQFAFDRGLTMIFAYQYDEAEVAFRQAARLDPSLAMAWWGIGLSLGANINDEPEKAKTVTAADALARAAVLAEKRATSVERDYVAALKSRYTDSPTPDFDQLATAYRDAMGTLVQKYPDDPDASALFAEAAMDLRPWRLWDSSGAPEPGTQELVDVIERGLRRHPDHLGLMHFYIHAVEASSDPGRALPAARRLAALPMEPAASHLVHMPAHIYLRVGDWQSAVEANHHAIHHAIDYRLSSNPKVQRACGHCTDFLSYAYMMQGNQAQARQSSEDYQKLTGDPTNTIAVLIRFRQWHDLLGLADPSQDLKKGVRNAHEVRGFWHFARGLAFVANHQLKQAQAELTTVRDETALAPPAASFDGPIDVQNILDKDAQTVDAVDLQIAAALLDSRIAESRRQMPQAIEFMRHAVELQDGIPYGEPPSWFYPVRESLGGLFLRAGSAPEAEKVFREDLRRSPNNPRSLLGLCAALEAQRRADEASKERVSFESAWRYSDEKLAAHDL